MVLCVCVCVSHTQVPDASSQRHLVALKPRRNPKSTKEDTIIKMRLGLSDSLF